MAKLVIFGFSPKNHLESTPKLLEMLYVKVQYIETFETSKGKILQFSSKFRGSKRQNKSKKDNFLLFIYTYVKIQEPPRKTQSIKY